jgi:hypothetical protein
MKQFKSAGQAQRFLSAHDQINNLFRLRRDRVTAAEHRASQNQTFQVWDEICNMGRGRRDRAWPSDRGDGLLGHRGGGGAPPPPQLAWLPVDQLTVDPAYFNSDHLLCAQRRNFRLVEPRLWRISPVCSPSNDARLGLSDTAVSRSVRIARSTVKEYLEKAGPPMTVGATAAAGMR